MKLRFLCAWLLIGVVGAMGQVATTPEARDAGGRARDLLSAAGEDHFWIARVIRNPDHTTQTAIQFRSQWTGSSDWVQLTPIAERAVSIAARNGSLLIVLANGQWQIGDDSGIRSGPTGSQWEGMLAIGSDSSATWAVVRWLPTATQPSTQESAATQASSATMPSNATTTMASTMPAGGASAGGGPEIRAASGPRLVVSSFSGGRWIDPVPLPEGVSDDAARMSLAVVDGLPVLAWETAEGKLCVSRLTAEHQWTAPEAIGVGGYLQDFKVLTIKGKAVLWIDRVAPSAATQATTGPSEHGTSDAGEVLVGDDFSTRIVLKMPTTMPSNISARTLVSAFGNLRWIASAGDQQIEQDFNEDHPDSLPALKPSVAPVVKPMMILLEPWAVGYSMLVALAALAGLRQRNMNADELPVQDPEEKLRLAPLGVRFVAGLVDLAPILAVIAVVHPAGANNAAAAMANIDAKSLEQLSEMALGTYILHTMIAEMFCGQSIGKMVFGLRVVNTEGETPRPASILLRSLLRVVDVTLVLPVLLVLITPLRQRVGDIVGGTVVIAKNGQEEEAEEKE